MPRRRRKEKELPGELFLKAALALVFLCLFVPEVRQFLVNPLLWVAWIGGTGLALWVGFRVWNSCELVERQAEPVLRVVTSEEMVADGSLVAQRVVVTAPMQRETSKPVFRPVPNIFRLPDPAPPAREPSLGERLRTIDWFQFEKLVATLFRARGFQVEENGGAKEDDGADLLLRRDGELTIVQCKHWRTWDVDKATVFQFVGAKQHWQASKAVMVSLNGLTGPAADLARTHGIETVEERQLVAWLEELRFTPTWARVEACLDATDKRCPKCGAVMVERTTGKGANTGKTFWGCSTFPRCRYTLKAEKPPPTRR